MRLVVGWHSDPADPGLGMEVEPPARVHIHPSKEETPLGLELTTKLGSEVELNINKHDFHLKPIRVSWTRTSSHTINTRSHSTCREGNINLNNGNM